MRALLSLVIAVVASVVGHALLWGAGVANLRSSPLSSGTAPNLPAQLLAVLGILLIAVAMLTAAWSSLGVVVLGLVQLVAGVGILVVSPLVVSPWLGGIERANEPVGTGIAYAGGSGVLLLTGVVFVVGGIAIASRLLRATASGRAVSLVLAVVLGLGMLPLVTIAAYRLIPARVVRLSPAPELLGLALLAAAAILLVLVVGTVRWSSLGVVVLGVLLAAGGGIALFAPGTIPRLLGQNPMLSTGSGAIGSMGGLLLLGVLLVVAGIAGAARAARKRAAVPALEVEERIGYQPEEPTGDLGAMFPPGSSGDPSPDERRAGRAGNPV